MKQHVEITYNLIEKNELYEELIEKVIDECFKNEKMDNAYTGCDLFYNSTKKIWCYYNKQCASNSLFQGLSI